VTSVLAEIARQLCDLAGDWSVAGDQVRGPGDTAVVVIEMFTQQQQFAAQFGPDDADGLPGCHVILGPVLAFGEGDPSSLQHWAVGTLLPAALAETLTPHLDPAGVNGVTLFFGGLPGAETVDARVNGAANEDLRAALLAMDWPRQPAFARLFMLVHKA
jgi:hypothetical protein